MQSNAATISNVNISACELASTNASAFTSPTLMAFPSAWLTGASAGVVTERRARTTKAHGAYLTRQALSSQTLVFFALMWKYSLPRISSPDFESAVFALAGGNNVTLQQSNNTVSISVGNYITQLPRCLLRPWCSSCEILATTKPSSAGQQAADSYLAGGIVKRSSKSNNR